MDLKGFHFTRNLMAAVILCASICGLKSQAQSSGLAWKTSVDARLFAVDEQTNLYAAATANSAVIVLSPDGVPLRTNAICPLQGIARRDGAGNYYFVGSIDGIVNFSGTNVQGGWVNQGTWHSGFPTCYLAKYSSQGVLRWVVSFGKQAYQNSPTDLLLDTNGMIYVAYKASSTGIICFDSAGVKRWEKANVGVTTLAKKDSSLWYLQYQSPDLLLQTGTSDLNGNVRAISTEPQLGFPDTQSTNGIPVVDTLNQLYVIGRYANVPTFHVLRKIGTDDSVVWDKEVFSTTGWVVAQDSNSIYVSGTPGVLARYSLEGDLLASRYFDYPCYAMIIDRSGNRFVSFADGSIGLLKPDGKVVIVDSCTDLANPVWTSVQGASLPPTGNPSDTNRLYRLRIP